MPHYNIPDKTITEIRGAPYKDCGEIIAGRIYLMHAVTGAPFLVPGPDGRPEMPTPEDYDELLRTGQLVVKEPAPLIEARRLAREAQWEAKNASGSPPRAARCSRSAVSSTITASRTTPRRSARRWAPSGAGSSRRSSAPTTTRTPSNDGAPVAGKSATAPSATWSICPAKSRARPILTTSPTRSSRKPPFATTPAAAPTKKPGPKPQTSFA